MKKFLFTGILASLVLVGCQSVPTQVAQPTYHHTSSMTVAQNYPVDTNVYNFECQNGLDVKVQSLNNQQMRLTVDGKSAVLHAVSSASGERFVSKTGLFGSGAEWHEKSGTASFSFKDPYGNLTETVCEAM